MKKIVAHLLSLFSLLCFVMNAQAQDVEQTLTKYADKYQPERIYLHYDKTTYAAGETIWYKAYLMSEIYPADESKTLYTDFIDDNGNVLSHNVSPIVEGVSSGQVDIPVDYASKYVHVRSYTKWTLNFDTTFVYQKHIRVLGKEAPKTTTKVVPQYSVQFFPEGGDLISGIDNKLAFKATDQWGRPIRIKGVILANDKPSQEFSSVHDGMGVISINPIAGTVYKARWKDDAVVEHTTDLPKSKPSGVSLQLAFNGAKRSFIINRTADAPPILQNLHVLGTMHGRVVFKATVSLTAKNTVQAAIPTEQFPSGVLTVTVFDAAWNAIAERITFIKNNDYRFQPIVTVQRWGLNKRARNEVEIKLPDSLQANLSVAVTDASIDVDSSTNIIAHLLLTSDLKGYVHNPAYYFKNNSDSLAHKLDLIMMTNGWRRFKWEEVRAGKFPAINYPKDTTYLSLSGKIQGVATGRLGPGDNIVLITKEKDTVTKIMALPLERDGSFGDPNIILFDSMRVFYQIKSKAIDKGDVQFMTARLPAPNYSALRSSFAFINPLLDTAGNYRHRLLAEEQARAIALVQGKTLQGVTVTARGKSPLQQTDEKYARGIFSGGDAVSFDLVNDPFALGQTDIFNYLQGKVAGLMITQSGGQTNLQWRGGSPSLYLDEMPVDADLLSSIPVNDIAYVKAFRPPFTGGAGGGSGAIAIYTRKGGDIQNTPGKGLSRNTVMGYTPIRQFYSPNYAAYDKRNEQPDLRTTIYWAPVVRTDAKKATTTIVFYNNDVTKSFRLIIEGMTKEGLLTHYEEVLE